MDPLPPRMSDANANPPEQELLLPLGTKYHCPTCKSSGFNRSHMINRCSFCDGTEGGHPPTKEEVEDWNWLNDPQLGRDPCDEVMP